MFLVLSFVIGRRVLPRVFQSIARLGSWELLLVFSVRGLRSLAYGRVGGGDVGIRRCRRLG